MALFCVNDSFSRKFIETPVVPNNKVFHILEDAEYRNPVLAKEIMDAIKDMDEEDLQAVLAVVRRLREKENLT